MLRYLLSILIVSLILASNHNSFAQSGPSTPAPPKTSRHIPCPRKFDLQHKDLDSEFFDCDRLSNAEEECHYNPVKGGLKIIRAHGSAKDGFTYHNKPPTLKLTVAVNGQKICSRTEPFTECIDDLVSDDPDRKDEHGNPIHCRQEFIGGDRYLISVGIGATRSTANEVLIEHPLDAH